MGAFFPKDTKITTTTPQKAGLLWTAGQVQGIQIKCLLLKWYAMQEAKLSINSWEVSLLFFVSPGFSWLGLEDKRRQKKQQSPFGSTPVRGWGRYLASHRC
jgi:hypothetical protein